MPFYGHIRRFLCFQENCQCNRNQRQFNARIDCIAKISPPESGTSRYRVVFIYTKRSPHGNHPFLWKPIISVLRFYVNHQIICVAQTCRSKPIRCVCDTGNTPPIPALRRLNRPMAIWRNCPPSTAHGRKTVQSPLLENEYAMETWPAWYRRVSIPTGNTDSC